MKPNRLPLWLIASVLFTALFSLYSIFQRNRVESRNKAVAIAVEYDTVESLAASQGLSVAQALVKLKPLGVNAVVSTEQTIGELQNAGKVQFVPEGLSGTFIPKAYEITLQNRIDRGIKIRFGGPVPENVSANLIRGVSAGLNPSELETVRNAGMMPIARYGNPAGLTEDGVVQTLTWGKELGASIYLPLGDQVLGRRDSVETTIKALKDLDILYATPEFSKITGDANVVGEAPDHVLRLHTAQVAELDRMSVVDAVERFSRAARERNMRVLLLRPISYSSKAPLDDFADFIGKTRDEVVKQGSTIGTPHPFTGPDLPRWWPILVALAAIPTIWFAATSAITNKTLQMLGAALLVMAALGAWTKMGTQVDAFLISLAFPYTGYIILDRYRPKHLLAGFALVSLLSFIGAMGVAGMLNGLTYYVQADEFRGVKLSVFFPIVMVGAYFFTRLVDWKNTMKSPITWGTAALGMLLLMTLAIVIARTGNDTGLGASDTELIFRNVLDRILFVRPRTKEFMIGHPMLIIGVGLLMTLTAMKAKLDPSDSKQEEKLRMLAAWTTMVLMVSAVGQTSIVNTMSHIHIPVVLSLARVLEGLVIGCIIGLVLWTAISRTVLKKVL